MQIPGKRLTFITMVLLSFGAVSVLFFGHDEARVFQEPPSASTFEATPQDDLAILSAFNNSLFSDSSCTLPCWWGFWPGKTPLIDLLQFLHENAFDRHPEFDSALGQPDATGGGAVYLYFQPPEELGYGANFWLFFDAERGILTQLHLQFDNPAKWLPRGSTKLTLPMLLAHMKATPRIFTENNSSQADFFLHLQYPGSNVTIVYWLDLSSYQTNVNWDPIRICPDIEAVKSVSIWITSTLNPNATPTKVFDYPKWAGPISIDFGITEEVFVRFFLENPTKCLDLTLRIPTATPKKP